MLLSQLTTAAVGGPAQEYVSASTEEELILALQKTDQDQQRLLVLGGGSNILVADAGFAGTVVHIKTQGIRELADSSPERTVLRVQAGHNWDDFVNYTLTRQLSGLEALSGIPGTVGATPLQNVGAYGAEVAHTICAVRSWDRQKQEIKNFEPAELQFSYRDSLLKQTMQAGSPRYVVLSVDFALAAGQLSAPIRYAELARQLGVELGDRVEASRLRHKVLALRASKGMVLDPADRDTYSTGSFFTNPIVDRSKLASLPKDTPHYPVIDSQGQLLEQQVKLSAAWLIQEAGFDKGFGLEGNSLEIAGGRASLSTKHTLAISNRGDASCADLLAIAKTVQEGVEHAFGVGLVPEPLILADTQ